MTFELFLVMFVVLLFGLAAKTWTNNFIIMSTLVTIIAVAASHIL